MKNGLSSLTSDLYTSDLFLSCESFHSQEIKDEAQVGAARRGRAALRRARSASRDDELAEIAIVVQEIGTNAARYATRRRLPPLDDDARRAAPGLELFYCDKGPGIYDLERGRARRRLVGRRSRHGLRRDAAPDSTSSTSTRPCAGTTRAPPARAPHDARHGHPRPQVGRAARRAAERARRAARRAASARGAARRPGEEVNGDAYFVAEHDGETLLAVVDGLGHGRGAREATAAALDTLEEWDGEPLDEVVRAAHDALRATRGAVMRRGRASTARARPSHYAGVGNVEVRVLGAPEPARPIPSNGTLGARLSHGARLAAPLVGGDDARHRLRRHQRDLGHRRPTPASLAKSPQLLAGVLLRDYGARLRRRHRARRQVSSKLQVQTFNRG